MKAIIEASILSADFGRLSEAAREAEAAGVDAIQVDVMDGRFVPPITFGSGVVKALRAVVGLPLDVHLMIMEPERHLAAFVEAGADRLVVHQEACSHLHRVLGTIRKLGVEAGVALNPATPVSDVEEVLEVADMIQVMTVNPGWGGSAFSAGAAGEDHPAERDAGEARTSGGHRRGRRHRCRDRAAGGPGRSRRPRGRIQPVQRPRLCGREPGNASLKYHWRRIV